MMAGQRVPILVYHHVYPDDAPELSGNEAGIIGEHAFRRQVRFLDDEGWRVVSTTQVVDWLDGKAALRERAVVLHFDNGWLDTATVTLPILRERGMTATCFPITDGINAAARGQTRTVRTLTEGVTEKPFMTWSQLQELVDAGWEIGAHTDTHCKVADMYAAEGDKGVIREAEMANEQFEEHLRFVPEHFAYPSGSRNKYTDDVLSRYYRSLRLWHFEWPINWTFTDQTTSLLAVDCQNIDVRVSFDDFKRIFAEALVSR